MGGDLHSEVGYFYSCPDCHLDFCPCCGLKRSADSKFSANTNVEPWDGCWTHKAEPGQRVEGILGDTIAWSTGSTNRIYRHDDRKLSVCIDGVDGAFHHAELVGDELIWSDGDVWTREAHPFQLLHA